MAAKERSKQVAALFSPAGELAEAASQLPPPDFSGVQEQGDAATLAIIPELVQELRELEGAALAAEEALVEAVKKLHYHRMVVLPAAMELARLQEMKMKDGAVIKVEEKFKATITEANQDGAYAWLRDHGQGAVIKSVFEVDVRTLSDEQRGKLGAMLCKKGLDVVPKESVHYQTLQALVRELLEAGTKLPPEISVHEYKQAALKEPKGK